METTKASDKLAQSKAAKAKERGKAFAIKKPKRELYTNAKDFEESFAKITSNISILYTHNLAESSFNTFIRSFMNDKIRGVLARYVALARTATSLDLGLVKYNISERRTFQDLYIRLLTDKNMVKDHLLIHSAREIFSDVYGTKLPFPTVRHRGKDIAKYKPCHMPDEFLAELEEMNRFFPKYVRSYANNVAGLAEAFSSGMLQDIEISYLSIGNEGRSRQRNLRSAFSFNFPPSMTKNNELMGGAKLTIATDKSGMFSSLTGERRSSFNINPHIDRGNGGGVCLGGFELPVIQSFNDGDWLGVLHLLQQFMNTVDRTDTWGKYIKGYPKALKYKGSYFVANRDQSHHWGIPEYNKRKLLLAGDTLVSREVYARCSISGNIERKTALTKVTTYVDQQALQSLIRKHGIDTLSVLLDKGIDEEQILPIIEPMEDAYIPLSDLMEARNRD